MRALINKFLDRLLLWTIKNVEVSRFDGIALIDVRKLDDSFQPTLENALQLVREHDPRRYARIKRYIHRIVNSVSFSGTGGFYDYSTRTCMLEFQDGVPGANIEALTGLYACFLVHESTHGIVEDRGIKYTKETRVQIEHLCVSEENRFAARLSAANPELYPSSLLRIEFDEHDWDEHWNAGPLKRSLSLITRVLKDKKPID